MDATMDTEKRLLERTKSLSDVLSQLEDLRNAHEFLTKKNTPPTYNIEIRNDKIKIPTEILNQVLTSYIGTLEAWLHVQPEYTAMIPF
jgi:hypothetical protein